MEYVAPVGPVYQAGTLSGNPLAMAAGLKQIQILKDTNPYPELDEKGKKMEEGLKYLSQKYGIPATVNRVSSMITAFFTDKEVVDFETAKTSDLEKYAKFFRLMLEMGVYFAPSQFEASFLSTAHSDDDIEETLNKVEDAFKQL